MTRDLSWGASWAAGIVLAHAVAWGLTARELAQFVIQFTLCAMALIVPTLLLVNLRRGPRWPLRWQVVLLLLFASFIAMFPWNSPGVGCVEC